MTENGRDGGNKGAMQQMSRAVWGSQRVFVDGVVAIQERTMNFAGGLVGDMAESAMAQTETTHVLTQAMVETTERQQRAFRGHFQEQMSAYLNHFFVPLYGARAGLLRPMPENGGRLPIENYDELTIEEIGKMLGELSVEETKKIRAYEKRHKNRATLIERFDRSLV